MVLGDSKVERGPAPPNEESSLLERQPRFEPPHDWRESGVAKSRNVKSRPVCQPFCQHGDLRCHVDAPLPEAADLARLVAKVRGASTGIFRG